MRCGKHAKDLVDEALADVLHAREVERHVLELFEPGDDAFGF